MSCGAACWRQLLRDQGVEIDEATLRDEAGYDATCRGILLVVLLDAMRKRSPSCDYVGGTIDASEVGSVTPPFLVVIKNHYLIVDALDDVTVTLRDPAPAAVADTCGSEVTMERSAFDRAWRGGIIFSRSKR